LGKVKSASSPNTSRKLRPALTPEARENQMISLAMDLVEQRLIDGTASSQETTHFLKLATAKYKYEQEILREQKELITAKTEQIHSTIRNEELMKEAINAFKRYSGYNGDYDEN
jgi:hypothetical protein